MLQVEPMYLLCRFIPGKVSNRKIFIYEQMSPPVRFEPATFETSCKPSAGWAGDNAMHVLSCTRSNHPGLIDLTFSPGVFFLSNNVEFGKTYKDHYLPSALHYIHIESDWRNKKNST